MSGPRPSLHAPLFPRPAPRRSNGSSLRASPVMRSARGDGGPGAWIAAGRAPERVWLLEHPPLYTAGTSAKPEDLLDPRFPVFRDRPRRAIHLSWAWSARRLCHARPQAPAARCARLCRGARRLADRRACRPSTSQGETRADRVGVWVARPDKPARASTGRLAEDKIAAIGVRVRRWTTFHGVALNVAPDLTHFSGIVPCGISRPPITA